MHPRRLAYDLLQDTAVDRGEFVDDRFDAACRELTGWTARDRGLALELVRGVLRRRLCLDTVLAACVSKPLVTLEPELLTLLRLGAYQLLFLDRIPVHAALDSTVELARELKGERWTRITNGVLRGLTRLLTPDGEEPESFTSEELPRVLLGSGESLLPVDGTRCRRLVKPVFPSPREAPADYVSLAFSLPRWLVARWQTRHSFADLVSWGVWFAAPPRVCLRVTGTPTSPSRDEFLETLRKVEVVAEPSPRHPHIIWLDRPGRVEELPGYRNGAFVVQDEAAAQAVDWLALAPGENVLDLCAAPGGKSMQIAEAVGETGSVLACDISEERLQRVRENGRRLKIRCVTTRLISESKRLPSQFDAHFDATLVDVPCSNTGVLGRRAEARWRLRPDDLVELPRTQARLLTMGLTATRPGGRVVYSTCSVEPEENERVIASVLASQPDWECARQELSIPGQPADGAFRALLRRRATSL